ncbi:SDR family oxidoreductase [Halorubellus sp. JP-L1]|uniref:SDR family NAD(P)-dependent oxidoreductase n=1 Tax=Halorubellus sp. JP-L1 TaxID=2715753 RepID=UPI00140D2F74|nr:SDR family oxidoreductase [Halorubellus sp. JP-L1]NHN41316.1 SDR family oxidoreductase [Halorubellus sp. JP-L1]
MDETIRPTDGATVVVTGATSGIGRAVATAFAAADATVVVCGRDASAVEAVTDDLERAGDGEVAGMRADVRDEFDVERLLETASRTGRAGVDVVVANAGVFHATPGEAPIGETSYAAFDDEFRTNVRGVFATFREALAHLNEDARLLVPTGSVARETKPGLGGYAPSKAGAEAVARQFAADTEYVAGCVDPGTVDTDLSGPGGRDPDEVAELFVWAATDCPADDLDGQVVGLREWKQATR